MKKILSLTALCSVVALAGCEKIAKNGDTVIIDYAGFLGTEQFEGGTAFNQPLTLGSGRFIPGFEEQLVGAKIGEERDIKVTFPVDYHATNLAGKETIFKVMIKDIKKK